MILPAGEAGIATDGWTDVEDIPLVRPWIAGPSRGRLDARGGHPSERCPHERPFVRGSEPPPSISVSVTASRCPRAHRGSCWCSGRPI